MYPVMGGKTNVKTCLPHLNIRILVGYYSPPSNPLLRRAREHWLDNTLIVEAL